MLESPWPILIFGLIAEAILAIALFRSGRGVLLWAMAGVALVVLLGVLLERSTITDTKRVRATLEQAAAGLAANNAVQVKTCIVQSPDGDPTRAKVDYALGVAEFMDVSLRNLEVKFNYQTSPPTAEANFAVLVRAKDHAGTFEESRPVFIRAKLRKESGRWLVYGVPEHDVHE